MIRSLPTWKRTVWLCLVMATLEPIPLWAHGGHGGSPAQSSAPESSPSVDSWRQNVRPPRNDLAPGMLGPSLPPSLPRAAAPPTPQSPSPKPSFPSSVERTVSAPRGMLKRAWRHQLEVVCSGDGIRIFLYDSAGAPLSPARISGDVVFEARNDPRQWRFPIEYVAQTGSGPRAHLAVRADLSRVRDGELEMLFELTGLPHPEEPRLRFAKTFALAVNAPEVTVVPMTDADQAAVARQRLCPVTNEEFTHGPPIKVSYGDRAIYVCCDSCIAEVRAAPQRFFMTTAAGVNPVAAPSSGPREPGYASSGGPTLPPPPTFVTESDRTEVERQRYCPVTHQALGAHGVPLRVSAGSRYTFVCCAECVSAADRLLTANSAAPATAGPERACQACRGN